MESPVTLAEAQSALAAYLAANEAVANSQSYSYQGRTLTRQDAAEIRNNIQYWSGQVALKQARAAGVRGPRRTFVRWDS